MQVEQAILNHHTRTSVMEGIVDLKLTLGPLELGRFSEENKKRGVLKQTVGHSCTVYFVAHVLLALGLTSSATLSLFLFGCFFVAS